MVAFQFLVSKTSGTYKDRKSAGMGWTNVLCCLMNSILCRCHDETEVTMCSSTQVGMYRLCIGLKIDNQLIQRLECWLTNDWAEIWLNNVCLSVVNC